MKILIIEDEKLLADSIKTLLENKGFQTEVAYDGDTGLEYALLVIYDLLILDVMMPGINGFQVARQVRNSRCNTPILMLTAKSEVENRIQGLNSGADYYLTKPFDTRELLACINALLRRQGNQVDELCEVLSENINFACDYIKEHFDGVEVCKPEGTYMLFLDCTKWCESHGKTIENVLQAGWDVGVAWQDGRMFHGPCSIRMNLALPLSRVEEAFDRLNTYVFK